MGMPTFPNSNSFTAAIAILNADGTGAKNLVATQPRPYAVDAILVGQTDAILHHLDLLVLRGGSTFNQGSCVIPSLAGQAGNAGVEVLALALPADSPILPLDAAATVSVNLEEAVTAGKYMSLVAYCHYL